MRTSSIPLFAPRAAGVAAAVLAASLALPAQQRPKFLSDDPLTREPETQDASKAQPFDIGLTADITLNLFGKPGDPTPNVKAQNINTIDEVPDSGWFTNRIYARPMTPAEVSRGANTLDGPAAGKWTVIRAKSAGTAPGFTIRDDKNETWFITLDAEGNPVAATAANVIASRLFWALGYNQVETYISSIRPENVTIGDKVTVSSHGKRRAFTRADLEAVFDRAHANADGSYRVVAARAVPGRVLGGFRYHGTRPDDPNDVVPHEHRRELRALQVFGGWTNLVDMKAGNTLDTVITENGRSVVRHYLQDVGSTFGTGALHPREGDEGAEYIYEGTPTAKRLFTLGLYVRPWQTRDYETSPDIGHFSAEGYEPDEWKPRVAVAALTRARADDTLWAALRVMAFTDEHIAAAVKAGQFVDPAADKQLTDIMAKRRDILARHYTAKVNPLTKFALDGSGVLTFENPAVRAKLSDAPKGGYTASFARFDNAARTSQPVGGAVTAMDERLQAPTDLPRGAGTYVKVSIAAVNPPHKSWATPVDVYFRGTAGGWQLVGVERLPEGNAPNSVKKP
jgi:hypothetical protein